MRLALVLALVGCGGEASLTDRDTDTPASLRPLDLVEIGLDALPDARPSLDRAPLAVDIDDDGDLDLLTAGPEAVHLHRADGGVFAAPAVFVGREGIDGLHRLDLGDDGVDDVLLLDADLEDVLVRLGAGGERLATVPLSTASRAVASGDIDGDGLPDVIAWASVGEDPPALWRLKGGAEGLGAPEPVRVAVEGPLDALALGDVDDDGDLDLLGAADGAEPRLWLGDGRGAFLRAPPETLLLGPGAGAHVALVDLDGDDDLDLVLAGAGQDRLLRNDGGRLVDRTALALPAEGATATGLAAVDLDDDGHRDLVLAHADAPLAVLRADGEGRWYDYSDVASAAPASVGATGLAVADLDDDGDPDVHLTLDDLRRPRHWRLWAPEPLEDGDGDGVPDAVDVCPTTPDPAQADTDAEPFACTGRAGCERATGCALHWVDGAAYLRCDTPRTYAAARDRCAARGGTVLVADDEAQATTLAEAGLIAGWVGLTDGAEEGTFVDAHGQAPAWAPWAEGEPNDAGEGEDCVQARGDGAWNDLPCGAELPFTCEAPPAYAVLDPGDACDVCPSVMDPDQVDTDGDGRGDACDPD